MVLYLESGGNVLAVRVDPSDPSIWRRTPYFEQLKQFAIAEADSKRVIVYIKNRAIVILPNKEVELGEIKPGDQLITREIKGANGRDWLAYVEPSRGSSSASSPGPH